ncbi:outer membrane protein [Aliiroseovarius sp. S253]|uniref:outer membrane protein n=1 Tax=Aliiroseovarius sp. S253 TaxID=3415133 RepID=UPI003C7EBCE6
MMKPASFLTAVTFLLIPGLSNAGSLNDPAVDAAVVYEDLTPWEGAYVGGTIGYHFPGGDRVGIEPSVGAPFNLGDLDISGWNGSLRAGYRWQFADFIVGSELAVEGGYVEDTITNGNYRASTKLNHALSLRVKAGTIMPIFDSFVYATVGLSRAEFDYEVTGSGGNGPISFDETYSTNGYILGVGFERPISDRWTLTGEYEYVNFGKDELTDGAGNTTLATPLFHTLKLGLNYNF